MDKRRHERQIDSPDDGYRETEMGTLGFSADNAMATGALVIQANIMVALRAGRLSTTEAIAALGGAPTEVDLEQFWEAIATRGALIARKMIGERRSTIDMLRDAVVEQDMLDVARALAAALVDPEPKGDDRERG